ncbi:MAG: hypothetical protein WEB06_16090 [Actinomycetota bacterium]
MRVAALLALAVFGGMLTTPARAPDAVTHPDEAPAGVDLNVRPTKAELTARRFGTSGSFQAATTAAASSAIACIGDGTDGVRVQAIYARASNVPDRFAEVAPLIAQYAADADHQLNVSAGLSGQGRRIRYVTEDCQLDIVRAELTAQGDNSFSASRTELRAQGFNRSDRKYLVWVDAAVGICGIAEMYSDDRASASNWNNSGNMFARVDAPCWGYAEAHELLHTIGAVQNSAAHSTDAGHCFDENDTMCYSDGSGVSMVSTCPALPSWHVDCNLDDYFNAAPVEGSYLETHWNSARSIYLAGSAALIPSPSISLSAPSSFYAGNQVGVSASVSVPEGRTSTIGWTTTRAGCKFTAATGSSSSFYCPATFTGSGQIVATVVDSLGMTASATKTFTLKKVWTKRKTITQLTISGKTLTAKVVDALTGKTIAGMRVKISYRRAGSKTWKKITVKTTGASGTFTYKVSPPKSTYYRLGSFSTPTWASDKSPKRKITI